MNVVPYLLIFFYCVSNNETNDNYSSYFVIKNDQSSIILNIRIIVFRVYSISFAIVFHEHSILFAIALWEPMPPCSLLFLGSIPYCSGQGAITLHLDC